MMTSLAQAALDNLLEQAKKAAEQSYSPYSGFKVGAALRLTNGKIVTGTNVENVSYGLTICAERAALVRAVSEYGPGIRIEAVAVANLNGAPSPPCGACRQMLAEFAEPDATGGFSRRRWHENHVIRAGSTARLRDAAEKVGELRLDGD